MQLLKIYMHEISFAFFIFNYAILLDKSKALVEFTYVKC